MTAYFVTGTDTGVGKTTVAAGLLAALRERGVAVAALKPAESGCERDADGELVPADGLLLRAACGRQDLPLDRVVPHRLATPVAPGVAARLEGKPFSLERARQALSALATAAPRPRLVLVEGAGGLLVPYADDLVAADVALALQLPLLVVARASLGTINHTLLTVHEARRRGLRVGGVILNRVADVAGPDEPTNPDEIRRLGDVPVLGTVPHLPPAARRDPAALARAVTSALDPAVLL